MSAAATLAAVPREPALPAPFNDPPAGGHHAPTVGLVRTVVKDLLMSSPAYRTLETDARRRLARDLVNVSSVAAENARRIWYESEQLGQRPVVRRRERAPVARAQASQGTGSDFVAGAASQAGDAARDTLNAIAFPVFVADLIHSTFDAIVSSSLKQMEAYGQLLANVSKSVEDFMGDNISEGEAHAWLASSYPQSLRLDAGRAVAIEGDGDPPPLPDFQSGLNLADSVSSLDEDTIEGTLMPAARRRIAESRLQMMATMAMMGVNRIVVTGGRMRATMGFHIDTRDRARQENANSFGFATSAAGSFGVGPWSASASMSLSYVTSSRSDSDADLNMSTDLTGEVEIHFSSDYFPVERFITGDRIAQIRGNTPVPEMNVPIGQRGDPIPWGKSVEAPAARPVQAAPAPMPMPSAPQAPPLPPLPSEAEKAKAEEKAKAAEKAKADEKAKAEEKAKADEKAKAEEKLKADEKAKAEEKLKASVPAVPIPSPPTNPPSAGGTTGAKLP